MPTKPNAKGRRKNTRYVGLDYALLESPAYRSLSPNARSLLTELAMLFNGSNNGSLFLSQRMAAERINVREKRTAAAAFRQLEDRRFIRVRVQGSFNNKTKLATTYIVTHLPYNDHPATRDFQRWKPPSQEKHRVQKTRRTGSKKTPSVPIDWPDGCDDSTCNANFDTADGGTNGPTYNIPWEGDSAEAPLTPCARSIAA